MKDHSESKAGEPLQALFGRRLRAWRERNGLPLKAIASDLGVSVATVSAWERGDRFPSGQHLEMLARQYKLCVCEFFWQGSGRCHKIKQGLATYS